MIQAVTDVEVSEEREEGTERETKYIVSDTFKPTGKKLGNGCWGDVDVYEDSGGQKWAIKHFNPDSVAIKQMQERGWTPEDVMRRESIPLDAAHRHIVPRIIERDKNGEMFIAMPVFEKDLSSKFDNLMLGDSLKIARDIADALGYIHEQREVVKEENKYGSWDIEKRKAHGDVKPSNILMKDKRAFLTDFGSSTCISIGGHGKERGPHGNENYRAPECFKENAKPSTRADIWSLGAILYEAITNQGIYNGLNREDETQLQKGINKKIRRAPRKIRGFLRNCLAVHEYNRFETGTDALKNLEGIIENLGAKKTIKDYARKFTLPIGLPIALAGLFVYGAATYEPQRLEMPKTNIQGMLYPPSKSNEEPKIEFEQEDINDLPSVETVAMLSGGINNNAKLSTDNRIVAYLVKTHAQVQFSRGGLRSDVYTDNQFKTYMAYTDNDTRQFGRLNGTPWPMWAKSVEVALNQAKTKEGKVDLEDVMAISRVGIEKVAEAKNVSGSVDYKDYRNAKDSKGDYIISKKEQSFINTWIAYHNRNID